MLGCISLSCVVLLSPNNSLVIIVGVWACPQTKLQTDLVEENESHGAQVAKSGFYSFIADLPIRFISLILRLSHIGISLGIKLT